MSTATAPNNLQVRLCRTVQVLRELAELMATDPSDALGEPALGEALLGLSAVGDALNAVWASSRVTEPRKVELLVEWLDLVELALSLAERPTAPRLT